MASDSLTPGTPAAVRCTEMFVQFVRAGCRPLPGSNAEMSVVGPAMRYEERGFAEVHKERGSQRSPSGMLRYPTSMRSCVTVSVRDPVPNEPFNARVAQTGKPITHKMQ